MQPYVPGSSGGGAGGTQNIVLARTNSGGGLTYSDAIITTSAGSGGADTLSLGSHFLTTDVTGSGSGDAVITKVEVDNMPFEVIVEKGGDSPSKSPGGKSGGDGQKKVCLWPTGSGTTCGKTFTKIDSLKRHLAEAHRGVRPFACTLCDKSYGRRDYLQRHLKSHNANYADNLGGSAQSISQLSSPVKGISANSQGGRIVKKVNMNQQGNFTMVQVQQAHGSSASGGTLQLVQHHPSASTISHHGGTAHIPFMNLNSSSSSGTQQTGAAGATPTKPIGTKICRWVQNDGTVCGKAFSKLDSLRRHVNENHKNVRPHACTVCDKNYGRRDYLERHLRTHNKKSLTKAEPGSIDWGPNSGVLMSGDEVTLTPKVPKKKRKDIPAEEKKICLWVLDDGTACGKTFTKFDSLKRHVGEAHKGVRPYCCTLCGKTYGRRDYLLRHLRSHNETEVAGLNIAKVVQPQPTQQAHVVQHVVVSSPPSINFNQLQPLPQSGHHGTVVRGVPSGHSQVVIASPNKKRIMDDKKTCKWVLDNGTTCGKAFSKFDSLRRHVNELHKGVRPFACTVCDKNYGRRDYLDRHLRSHATGETIIDDDEMREDDDDDDDDEVGDNVATIVSNAHHDDEDDDDDGGRHMDAESMMPNVVTVVSSEDV